MRDLMIEEASNGPGTVEIFIFVTSKENVRRIIAHPLVVIAADGMAVAPYGILRNRKHPRCYGTFARILGKYVREEKILSLEQAIRKMSSVTAQKFGLEDRGQIKEGYFADLVIFDSDKVIDRATYEDPYQYPDGIDQVIVNGQVVVQYGEHTKRLPGKILKKSIE